MVGPINTQTKAAGIITDEMHPYTFFIETPLLENYVDVGMHPVCYYPYYSCLHTFGPIILTHFLNLFNLPCHTYIVHVHAHNVILLSWSHRHHWQNGRLH